jgi:hypothetical protein
MTSLRPAFKNSTNKFDKRVSFGPDTNFERGRSSAEYSRNSTYYKPGSYAASIDHMLENTSFFKELDFNCSQLKVRTNTPHKIDSLMSSCKAPSQNEGVVEHHPRNSEIIEILNDQNHDNSALKDFLGRATWLLLAVDDNELIEIFLHKTLEGNEA